MNNTIYKEHKQAGHSLLLLAVADLVKTYRGAALGWAWSLIRPAMMIGVYWFVLGTGLRAGDTIEGATYFQWLIAGILPWFYIRDMFGSGTKSYKKYKHLVTKIKFPVSTIPTMVSLSNMIVSLVLTVLIILLLVISGVEFGTTLIQLPFFMFLMFVMMTAWALFAAPIAAISKDFSNLMKSVTQILFWISGILYSVDIIENNLLRQILELNPIHFIVEGFRKSLIYGEWFYEDMSSLITFLLTLAALLIISRHMFYKARETMVDSL